jgi:hypothetical protein
VISGTIWSTDLRFAAPGSYHLLNDTHSFIPDKLVNFLRYPNHTSELRYENTSENARADVLRYRFQSSPNVGAIYAKYLIGVHWLGKTTSRKSYFLRVREYRWRMHD